MYVSLQTIVTECISEHKGLCFHLAGKRTFRTPPEDDSTSNPNFRAEYEIYNPNG